jgi:hypothetical protein
MRARSGTCQRLAFSLLIALLVFPLEFGGARAFQTDDVPDGYYESPTYGYLVRLDFPGWQVADEQSSGGLDHLVLSGQAGLVAFDGYTGFGGDPKACLAAEEVRVAADPSISQFSVAVDEEGKAAESYAPGWAYRIYTLVAPDANGVATEFALTIDCRTLVPGSAVLEVRHYVALSAYGDAVSAADWLMHAVVFPRRSVVPLAAADSTFYPSEKMEYATQSGSYVAEVAVTHLDETPVSDLPAPAPAGTHWVAATIRFSNTGEDGLEIDAGAPYVVDQFGGVTTSSYYRWDWTDSDPSAQVQTLAGGSDAIAVSWFAVADGMRVAEVDCDCFQTFDYGTRQITSFRPRLGQTGPLTDGYYDCMHYPRQPMLVFDRAGNERAMVTAIEFDQPGNGRGDQLTLAVENTSDAPWTFDPRNVVVWGIGDSRPVDTVWEVGAAGAGIARTLAPGERAFVRLSFATELQIGNPLELSVHYWAASDQEVFLASLVPCQGTAGRPILRGMS